jgi:molybdopterin-guanine dinucleotide biosynthesis protein B
MKIIAFVGTSDTGKTQLIQRLIGELKSRGNSVSVIKHCAHGFDLEAEGKDSAQFVEAGSDSVCMYSSGALAVLQKKMPDIDAKKISIEFLKCCDFILVEGGRSDKTLKKIEVLRKGVSEKTECYPEELIAIISDFDVGKDIPVFHPEEINKVADFLENQPHEKGSHVYLDIDNVNVPMNPFVQKIITNAVMGMVDSLEGIPENPECITLTLTRKWEKR